MQPEESSEFIKYLNGIKDATNEGRMNWESVNPTTFVWKRGDGHTRIILQRISASPKAYKFQGFDVTNTAQISQSSVVPSALGGAMDALFLAIRKKLDQKGLDFLKSIVPPN